jgi:hypothetical protein
MSWRFPMPNTRCDALSLAETNVDADVMAICKSSGAWLKAGVLAEEEWPQ